ncbi:MAG TPA: hypothetical protein VGK29_18540 [Paludibaculum sp.]|jgi:hypothetical protein
MVLTREELIAALHHEVRILVHLTGKVDPAQLDYRPTLKQRSTLELLQYLAIMGPTQIPIIREGAFTRAGMSAAWTPAEARAKEMDFDQTTAAIQALSGQYTQLLSDWTEDELRSKMELFGRQASRGSLLVTLILNAHAAYRTQLFCYLKACGRDELNTMNLWGGVDAAS